MYKVPFVNYPEQSEGDVEFVVDIVQNFYNNKPEVEL
jgi:hypothetical protein